MRNNKDIIFHFQSDMSLSTDKKIVVIDCKHTMNISSEGGIIMVLDRDHSLYIRVGGDLDFRIYPLQKVTEL